MNVITENPIVYIGANDKEDEEIFLYAEDKPLPDPKKSGGNNIVGVRTPPTPTQIEEAKKKGLNWDKINNVFVKAKELGLVDALLNKIGLGGGQQNYNMPPVQGGGGVPPTEEKKGMSTQTKVLIGVGVLAIVGTIIVLTRKK